MPVTGQYTASNEDRVPWNQLIAYGMGGLIPIALFNIAGQLIQLLGNISLGLSAVWLGFILMIPRLWDAISDPVMGHLSDNTRSRWGRRRPYILIGGITVALSFAAMWWVPQGESIEAMFPSETVFKWFQLAFILIGVLLFFTACTVFEIPHGALGMEMSSDYHERTRLFSAKSFLGNLFAMGTPWLIFLAGLEIFRGPEGNLNDGMRYVSMIIAAVLIPMSFWWFYKLKEPGFTIASQQEKSAFWPVMQTTVKNRTFLILVAIIFTLAMGFNFVSLFNFYITIFYLYGGNAIAAGMLLGINGTVWAVTGLVAVFPLNWLSKRFGKSKTLLVAILLMCAAQLAKIVCYNPEFPYLIVIPTFLLSAGMLMFFTLGSSMVGDICDEDELHTGTRSEGSYYSVYWWFIKMGTAFAGFVTGLLLLYTSFDKEQNKTAEDVLSNVSGIHSAAEDWVYANRIESILITLDLSIKSIEAEIEKEPFKDSDKNDYLKSLLQSMRNMQTKAKKEKPTLGNRSERLSLLKEKTSSTLSNAERLSRHFSTRLLEHPELEEHTHVLISRSESLRAHAEEVQSRIATLNDNPEELLSESKLLVEEATILKQQSPQTLFRLRLVEIGLPLVLCVVSILLTLRYPLTEARCYEIKEALKKRHSEQNV